MCKSDKVAILLATYNSANYLDDLFKSIFEQTYSNWCVYVRDDCSSDNTVSIINSYNCKFPDKFKIIYNNDESLGAYRNFVYLLEEVESDYYMFCDHDDVWLPYKIEKSMICIKELERKNESCPILIHSDMIVVDEYLNTIYSSFWKYSRLLPDHHQFKELVACNCANGCTMLFNKFSKTVALKNVKCCLMHDALLAQSVASVNGVIFAINIPTVLYRQHKGNVLGASKVDFYYWLSKIIKLSSVLKRNILIWRMARQIKDYSIFIYIYYKIKINILRHQIN